MASLSALQKALNASRLTEAEWAAEAGVHRKQAHDLLAGGTVRRDTLRRLLAPLGLTCCVAQSTELAVMTEGLASLDAFLGTLEQRFKSAEPLLVYVGARLTGLRSDEIAELRAQVAAARRYLLKLERNDDATGS